MDVAVTLVVALICLAAGIVIGVLHARSRSAVDIARLQERLATANAGEQRLEQSLRTLTHDAAREQKETLGTLVAPLRESLSRYEREISEMERSRIGAYAELRTQLREVAGTSDQLRTQTGQLVSALRAPQVRGRWGEHQLRRIVESAGLVEHCDFDEQVSAVTDAGGVRPDLVVRLAGGKQVVVDAKAPFTGYLEAMEARDEPSRNSRLDAHARHLRAHVDQLSAKTYWSAFETTPEFVVLFVPADTFLDAALQRDPTLLEHGFARNVVIATPATLIALLRTVAYAWRQDALAANAAEVHRLGKELYGRLATMGSHVAKLGGALSGAVTAYNKTVGSLESRVLVTARKFADLGVAGEAEAAEALGAPPQVELAGRQLQAPELVASEHSALVAFDDLPRVPVEREQTAPPQDARQSHSR
ncbi:MAG: DNA recombination protein RmuC [Actinocatenispora sp.]